MPFGAGSTGGFGKSRISSYDTFSRGHPKEKEEKEPSFWKNLVTTFTTTLAGKAVETVADKAADVLLSPLTGGDDTYGNNAAIWDTSIEKTMPKWKDTGVRASLHAQKHYKVLAEPGSTPNDAAYAAMYEPMSDQVAKAFAEGKLFSATGATLKTTDLSKEARETLIKSLVKKRMHANNNELLNQYNELTTVATQRTGITAEQREAAARKFNPLARSWLGKTWNSVQGETDETLIAAGIEEFRRSALFQTNLAAKKALNAYDANANYETGVNVIETVAIQEHLNRISAAEYGETSASKGIQRTYDDAGNVLEVSGTWVQTREGNTYTHKFVRDQNAVPKSTTMQRTEFEALLGNPIRDEIRDIASGTIYNHDAAGKFIVELNETFGEDIRTLESRLANAESPEEKEEVRQTAQNVLNAIGKWKTNGANLNTAYSTVEKEMYLKFLETAARRKASWRIKYEQGLPPPEEGEMSSGWSTGKEYVDVVKAYNRNRLKAFEEYEQMEREMIKIRAGFEADLIHVDGVTAVPIGSKINEKGETVFIRNEKGSFILNVADRKVNQRKFDLWNTENRIMTDKEENDIREANKVVEN
tara:strand:+ start:2189 stop:3955 length:1767 start_codon:yes stop_codon:yes gene_type:complete